MAKKLKIEDIPERYNYVAVDSDGCAYAYIEKPELLEDSFDGDYDPLKKSLFIGIGYDASNWQNSLVCREPEQKPEAKKLTGTDIPDGYEYAALDKDGRAYAYIDIPIRLEVVHDSASSSKARYKNPSVFIGSDFDASDWQNSLVSRESKHFEPAYKETTNKLSYSEIDPYFLEAMARRMNEGKRKYGPNNWKKLSDINELLDAAQRHLLELRKMMEEDFEPVPGQETDLQHCAALACNAMFIHYHLNPNT